MHNEAEYVKSNKEDFRACQTDIFEVAAEIYEQNILLRRRIKELTNTHRLSLIIVSDYLIY